MSRQLLSKRFLLLLSEKALFPETALCVRDPGLPRAGHGLKRPTALLGHRAALGRWHRPAANAPRSDSPLHGACKRRRRAEQWVVASSATRGTRGDEILALREHQSIYVPVATKYHRKNAGNQPQCLVEVQSGDYLGENVSVCFADRDDRT